MKEISMLLTLGSLQHKVSHTVKALLVIMAKMTINIWIRSEKIC